MKVIIAGSRHMPRDLEKINDAVCESLFEVTEVVCGLAKGADTWGKEWAGNRVPVKEFPADWTKYGKAAGPIRNSQMAAYSDALIAFIYDGSRGTKNMIDQMKKLGKPVYIVTNGVLPS